MHDTKIAQFYHEDLDIFSSHMLQDQLFVLIIIIITHILIIFKYLWGKRIFKAYLKIYSNIMMSFLIFIFVFVFVFVR